MTQPTPPLELAGPVPHQGEGSAIHDAMKLALAGDFTALDRIEIDYLNLKVRIGELKVRHADGEAYWWHLADGAAIDAAAAPFVTAIRRGFARDGRSALEWGLHEKCRRCEGKLRRLPCRVCDGRWYVTDTSDHETVYTDVDGVLLEDQS